jgi:hypothetical protein
MQKSAAPESAVIGAKRCMATKHLLKYCGVYPLRNGIDEKDPSPSQKETTPVYLWLRRPLFK